MMRRSIRGGLAAAALLGAVAALPACALHDAPTIVTLEVLGKRNAPADASWAAYADGSGAWHALRSSWPGTYEVRPDGLGRYAIAVGCASDPPSVTIFNGTAEETMTLSAKCELEDEDGCGEEAPAAPAATSAAALSSSTRDPSVLPEAGALLFTVDVTGLPLGERAFTYFHGDPLALDESMGPVYVSMGRDNVLFFTLVGPESAPGAGKPDPNAVTAWTWATASSGQPAVHIVAGGEGSNVTAPELATVTVAGASGDAVTLKATLKLPHAVRVPLGSAEGETMTYRVIPAEIAAQSEEASTMLSAAALEAEDPGAGRSVRSVQVSLAPGAPPVAALALAETPLAAVERAPDGTVRWHPYHDAGLGTALAYQLSASVGPETGPTLLWRAAITPGWLAASGNRTGTLLYRFPDLGEVAAGEWLIPDGATGTWELDALLGTLAEGGNIDLGSLFRGHDVETPGATQWTVGRAGPM